MGILVRVTDLSPDDHLRDYGAGALIRLERAPSEDGTYVEIDTEPIVSAKFSYEIHDPTGTSSSWYRSRYSSADPGATLFSEYSDPWSDAAPTTYANLDDFLLRVGRPLTERETRLVARIEDALADSTDRLEDELKMSFFRSPASGADEVRLFDGDGSGVLHVHSGIIELTSARFRLKAFADFADLDLADVRLEYWADAGNVHNLRSGEPYDHVVMTGTGTQRYWPKVGAGIELTGAFQWPRIPRRAKNASIDLARQALAADPTFAGSPLGQGGDLGRPMGPNLLPRSVYDLSKSMSQRFWCDL